MKLLGETVKHSWAVGPLSWRIFFPQLQPFDSVDPRSDSEAELPFWQGLGQKIVEHWAFEILGIQWKFPHQLIVVTFHIQPFLLP